MLAAFALRAALPVGFMPAGNGSFTLVPCPGTVVTLQPSVHEHAHHGDLAHHAPLSSGAEEGGSEGTPGEAPSDTHHQAFEHCPFGSAPALGPAALTVTTFTIDAAERVRLPDLQRARDTQPLRAHQARGPPQLA